MENSVLDSKTEELNEVELPFNINLLPTSFPNPNELVLNIE